MNRSIPDPFQLSRKGSRSAQDPKKVECDPDRELLRSVPDHVWIQVYSDTSELEDPMLSSSETGEKTSPGMKEFTKLNQLKTRLT